MPNPNPKLAKEVIRMIEDGKTSGQIMDALGLTRGQIAGIRHRAKAKASPFVENVDRAEDQDILRAVKLRAAGLPPAKVAYMMRRETEWVHQVTFNVKRDDLQYSGDKPGAVRGAYW